MKNQAGFTLVEFAVTLVIIGVLTVICMPIYKGFIEKVRLSEAKVLTGSILSAQRVYYARYGEYYDVPSWVDYDETLTIDSRSNRYFIKAKTTYSARYPGAIEAGAYSQSQNIVVYQFWPANSGLNVNLPRWLICAADTDAVIAEEW
ncbi:MAG: prepilin-type N-terminal cleavage/methylation domain-containing protein [Endomicrobium sp.]|jgi:prepilin-type N-terminal cleavage/methylation domain-containing protein|nr:prepilin-type N-terminal cleavage/methylation domain-containing protein [Endomicrobium sp.]